MFQALQPDVLDNIALEHIDKNIPNSSVLTIVFPKFSVKYENGFQAFGYFVDFEFFQTFEIFDAKLNHVQKRMLVCSAHYQIVWTLLIVRDEHE